MAKHASFSSRQGIIGLETEHGLLHIKVCAYISSINVKKPLCFQHVTLIWLNRCLHFGSFFSIEIFCYPLPEKLDSTENLKSNRLSHQSLISFSNFLQKLVVFQPFANFTIKRSLPYLIRDSRIMHLLSTFEYE